MNHLDELATKHGTDKGPGAHNYTAVYYERLLHLVQRSFRLLEIGVFGGASLRMWEEFFPLAQVHGIDIDPACLAHAGGRVAVDMVDQGCKEALAEYGRRAGGFELIIDDGGHAMAPQILSFEVLFPTMPPGGIYIIEDTGSSYVRWGLDSRWPAVRRRAYIGGGLHEAGTTVKYFHRLTDMLNIGRGRVRMPNGSKGRPFPRGVVADRFVEPCHLSIESVEFLMELIIVRKAAVGQGAQQAEVGVRPRKCRPRMSRLALRSPPVPATASTLCFGQLPATSRRAYSPLEVAMKTVLKMLTGLAWLLHSRRASCPPAVAALRPPSREALFAAAAHHRRAAAKCDAGDECRALHEKHAERYMAKAGSSRQLAHDPVFDRMHHVTWAEMRDGLHYQRLALEGGGP